MEISLAVLINVVVAVGAKAIADQKLLLSEKKICPKMKKWG